MVSSYKVLISTANVFTLGFAVWSGVAYANAREFWALASTVGFGVATVVLMLYLKNLRRFLGT
jgi:hypothetical protein